MFRWWWSGEGEDGLVVHGWTVVVGLLWWGGATLIEDFSGGRGTKATLAAAGLDAQTTASKSEKGKG